MIKVKFAELHNPIFVNGVNLSNKLDVTKRKDLKLAYDRKEKELQVTLKDVTTFLPASSVSHYIPIAEGEKIEVEAKLPEVTQPVGKIKAQVSDPTSQVQNPRK